MNRKKICSIDNVAANQPMKGATRPRRHRMGRLSAGHTQFHSPGDYIPRAIAGSLDPKYAPSKVRSLKDMSPEERAKMIAMYGKEKLWAPSGKAKL